MSNMQKTSAGAVWSLVLGILGVLGCSLFTGIPAIVCGHVSRDKIQKSGGALGGDGMALAGLIMGYISVTLLPLIAIVAILVVKAVGTKTTNTFDNIQSQMTTQGVR